MDGENSLARAFLMPSVNGLVYQNLNFYATQRQLYLLVDTTLLSLGCV